MLNKYIKTKELYDCKVEYLKDLFDNCEYPWQMLPKIKDKILYLLENGIEGFSEYKKGVLIGRDVKISPNVTIEAPAVIGHSTEIRPGAYIRGNLITGNNCVLGNSSEYKNSILLDNVQTPHYNYVGDSVLGNGAHMGAGSICSNLKSDKKPIVIHAESEIETNLRKIGGILADGADIGCGCVINPGTVVGKNSSVYPLTSIRGIIPNDHIVKSMDNIVKRI